MKILKVCQECGKTNNETKMYRFEDGYLCNRHYQQIKNNGVIKHTRYDSNIIAVNGDLAEIELYNYYGEFKGVAIMDSDDVNKISKFKWHLSNNGYVGTDFKGERILLHRLLINPSIEDVVDHINGNPLDNRKCNLRIFK